LKIKFAKHQYLPVLQTTIGHDGWIGEGVYIKAGITVGDGAVIGTGAVVTRNIPPYAIVAGNPAKLIRMRFDEDTVNALMKMQWWNLSDAKLIEVAQYFHDPQYMLRKEGFL
jgi:acetyltransferase-like isoleucine patch superfamily enzyme